MDSTGRHLKVNRAEHGSTILVKPAFLLIAMARRRWHFPCVALGSNRSTFGPEINCSATHSTVRPQLLLPCRLGFRNRQLPYSRLPFTLPERVIPVGFTSPDKSEDPRPTRIFLVISVRRERFRTGPSRADFQSGGRSKRCPVAASSTACRVNNIGWYSPLR